MKSKYIFGLLAVGTAMSLVSCDDFIDDNRYPLDRQTVNPEFWSNDVNVQNQINYFYEDYSGYGNGSGGGDFYWSWLSDDQAGRTKFADWTFTSIPPTSGSWTAPYTEIRRANLVIEGVESSTLNDVAKANFIAQARLHRARSFYDLVRRYGDVPLVTKALDPTDQAELFGARTPRNQVMDYVLADLDYAVANIGTQSNKTQFSKDMAQAFKLEVCLYEGAYAKYHQNDKARSDKFYGEAVKAGEAIATRYPINSSYASLYQSFRTAGGGFNGITNNSEIIFCKTYADGVFMNSISDYSNASDGVAGITKDAFDAFVFKDGLPASKTSYNKTDHGTVESETSISIANLLDVRDQRLSVITYDHIFFPGLTWAASNTVGQWSSTGYGVAKFNNLTVPQSVVNEINKNYLCAPLFWGGRLYVGILEAKAELGTLTDADLTKYMKPLWERAGIDTSKLTVAFLNGINDPKNKMGVSSLIYEIRRLRRCELMLDDGIRYWDLVRWHQLDKLDFTTNPDIVKGAYIADAPADITAGKMTADGYYNCDWGQTRKFDKKYYFYPIPQNQLQLNDVLTQNDGWK